MTEPPEHAATSSSTSFYIAVGDSDTEKAAMTWKGFVPTLVFNPIENGAVHWLTASGGYHPRTTLQALLASEADPKATFIRVSDGKAANLAELCSGFISGVDFRALNKTTILVASNEAGKVESLMQALRAVTAVRV